MISGVSFSSLSLVLLIGLEFTSLPFGSEADSRGVEVERGSVALFWSRIEHSKPSLCIEFFNFWQWMEEQALNVWFIHFSILDFTVFFNSPVAMYKEVIWPFSFSRFSFISSLTISIAALTKSFVAFEVIFFTLIWSSSASRDGVNLARQVTGATP